VYFSAKQYPNAEASLERAIAIDPRLFSAYVNLGNVYAAMKAPEKAIARFRQAAGVAPKSPAPHMMLGVILEQQGRLAEARAAYEKALGLDSRFAPAANNLAYHLAEHGGDLQRALQLARVAREVMPDSPQVADTLGWVHFKLGEYRAAIDLLRESVDRLPANAVVHYHLGLAYAKAGDRLRARQELREALRLDPRFSHADDARKMLEELGG
jgi:Flp pilus assembly protein TadD